MTHFSRTFIAIFSLGLMSCLYGMESTQELCSAIALNEIENIRTLIGQGVNVNLPYKHAIPLHVALSRTNTDLQIVGLLLDAGADVNSTYKNTTPLNFAVLYNNAGLVALLLKHNANPNIVHPHGMTPLHSAIKTGSLEIAMLLISNGADTTKVDTAYSSPLHFAVNLLGKDIKNISTTNKITLIKELVQKGSDLSAQDARNKTALDLFNVQIKRTTALTSDEILEIKALLGETEAVSTPAAAVAAALAIPTSPKLEDDAPNISPDTDVQTPNPTPASQPVADTPDTTPSPTNSPAAPTSTPNVGDTPATKAPLTTAALPSRQALLKKAVLAVGATVTAYGLYWYLTQQEAPIGLTPADLEAQLTAALAHKQHHYAYQLVLKNPQAVQALVNDTAKKQNLEEMIDQAISKLNDPALANKTWNLYQQLVVRHFFPTEREYLKDLSTLIDITAE